MLVWSGPSFYAVLTFSSSDSAELSATVLCGTSDRYIPPGYAAQCTRRLVTGQEHPGGTRPVSKTSAVPPVLRRLQAASTVIDKSPLWHWRPGKDASADEVVGGMPPSPHVPRRNPRAPRLASTSRCACRLTPTVGAPAGDSWSARQDEASPTQARRLGSVAWRG
ncbi:hypothetical protein C8Q79DRAFT_641407 [Trametes meyenii]|nr:hypothetical protein C8Q79DRAFT_641407 [Trametes meyenii]